MSEGDTSATEPVRRVHVLASGRVQGVFFRDSLRRQAQRLGVTGWARNLPDGRVEAELQGAPEAVEAAVEYCRAGPGKATVTGLEAAQVPEVVGERGFDVQ